MAMEDRVSKSFDVLVDTCKQLLTLATGIIVITATFTHDFLGNVSGLDSGLALGGVVQLPAFSFGWHLGHVGRYGNAGQS